VEGSKYQPKDGDFDFLGACDASISNMMRGKQAVVACDNQIRYE
jgi:hypothetical protein